MIESYNVKIPGVGPRTGGPLWDDDLHCASCGAVIPNGGFAHRAGFELHCLTCYLRESGFPVKKGAST